MTWMDQSGVHINDDQSGYLKGRYIGQNIRILVDITFFTKQSKLPGIILNWFWESFRLSQLEISFQSDSHVNYNVVEWWKKSLVSGGGERNHFVPNGGW